MDAGRWLPGDRFLRSYDTWSDVQIQAAATLEAYLSAAEDLSRMAIGVGDQLPPPAPVSYPVPADVSQHAWDRVEGAPYGTRGGAVVLHHFPVAGEYVFSVRTGLGQGTMPGDVYITIDGESVAVLGLPVVARVSGGSPAIRSEPILVRAGQRQVSVAFSRSMDGPYEDLLSPHDLSAGGSTRGGWANHGITALPHLTGFAIDGPYNPASGEASGDERSREIIFSCYPALRTKSSPAPSLSSRVSPVRHTAGRLWPRT